MIIDKLVTVKVSSYSKDYYAELGYEVPDKARAEFQVSSLDVKSNAAIKVPCKCEGCGLVRDIERSKYKPLCKKCATTKRNKAQAKPEKLMCPECGGKKSYASKVCLSCRDLSGENNPMFGKSNPKLAELSASKVGDKHWNWKGGVSKERNTKMVQWAKDVKELSDNKCVTCGYDNPLALDAHHITAYEHGSDLNNDIDNGACLCKNCHSIFHKTYGFGNNTPDQFNEFKESFL